VEFALEIDVTEPEMKYPGSLDVWLSEDRDSTYLGVWFGLPEGLALGLEEHEFHGLANYIRRLPDDHEYGYLAGMEVRTDLMGKGIGTEMVKVAFSELARRRVDAVFLHRSAERRSSDEQLKRFYSRFGFRGVRCCSSDFFPVMVVNL